MTGDIPAEPDGRIRCTDCGTTLDVIRKTTRTLAVTCDCDELRSIKVATALPEGWGV